MDAKAAWVGLLGGSGPTAKAAELQRGQTGNNLGGNLSRGWAQSGMPCKPCNAAQVLETHVDQVGSISWMPASEGLPCPLFSMD